MLHMASSMASMYPLQFRTFSVQKLFFFSPFSISPVLFQTCFCFLIQFCLRPVLSLSLFRYVGNRFKKQDLFQTWIRGVLFSDPQAELKTCVLVSVITDYKHFKKKEVVSVLFSHLRQSTSHALMLDARNVLDPMQQQESSNM